jgi:hypothetical protein
MKLTMNPSRAYLLALWKSRRTKEGVGIEGKQELCEIFLKLCLDEKLAQADKVKFGEPINAAFAQAEERDSFAKCYFYNSAIRAWLDSEMEKREERLRFKNEFAANYFAGLFDARGGFIDVKGKEYCYFFGDRVDEIVLLRLGFRSKIEKKKIAVLALDFYGWIYPYLRMDMSRKRA